MQSSKVRLKLRHSRLRRRVVGSPSRPRLCVHFSGLNVYAQIIDDSVGLTLASASTTEKGLRRSNACNSNTAAAFRVGEEIARRALVKNITSVVFDRGGFQYHGKVKALADAARSGGLNF
jgi:large subunit ribosomal protein L18